MHSYVHKVPFAANAAMRRGSAYHDTLELLLRHKIDNKQRMVPREQADRWAVVSAKKYELPESEVYRVVDAVRFYHANLYELHTPIAVEESFEIVRGGVKITGRIDLVDLMQNDKVVVIDHKFSYDTWAESRAKYGCQPAVYQWACKDHITPKYGYEYGGFAYNIIRLYPSPKIQLIEIKPLTLAESDWWEEQLVQIANCMISGYFPARSTDGNCTRCSYRETVCHPVIYDVHMSNLTGRVDQYEEDGA